MNHQDRRPLERYRVDLQAQADDAPGHVRLKRFLKLAWRVFKLRCVRVEELPAEQVEKCGRGQAETDSACPREPTPTAPK